MLDREGDDIPSGGVGYGKKYGLIFFPSARLVFHRQITGMLRVGLWVSALRELFMDRKAEKQLENHAVSGVVYIVEAKIEKKSLLFDYYC